MSDPIRVLVAGLGNMGRAHAMAYHNHPGYEIVGLVTRGTAPMPEGLETYPHWTDFTEALAATTPDLASINTYSDTHADYAVAAMEAGAHVFIEKPLATTVADAERVIETAQRLGRKLVVGYILRHHPSWVRLIEEARNLGGPYVFRMNLNQQSAGRFWQTHKTLMETTSPIVDCEITDAKPVQVRGMGVRLSDEIDPQMYNYGHLQVLFDDGSVGWYEAAWGPMISETAFFVKDIMTPRGSVSIVMDEGAKSSDHETHTKTDRIRIHRADLGEKGEFIHEDEMLSMEGEPGHDALCAAEQAYMHRAIVEDIDLTRHMQDAVQSLRICLAADESVRTGKPVDL
jgi:predicted dehydrogenase